MKFVKMMRMLIHAYRVHSGFHIFYSIDGGVMGIGIVYMEVILI